MDFVFTETFYATYESLSDRDVTAIDKGIRRLMTANATGWARQGGLKERRGALGFSQSLIAISRRRCIGNTKTPIASFFWL